MNVVADLAVQGGNGDVCAQGRLGEGDGHLTPNVIAPALKEAVGPHGDVHMQIAVGAAVAAGVAVAGNVQHLLIVDAGGNGDFHGLLMADAPRTVAVLTGGLNDPARAPAAVTAPGSLHHAKGRTLADAHLARAAALGAGLGLGALGRAGTTAALAGLDLPVCDILLTALGGLLKGNGHHGLGVAAAAGGIGVRAAAAAKPAPKEAVENIAEIHAHTAEGVSPTGAAAKVGVHARVAKLVVPGLFILIGQHLVGLVDFFKLGFGLLVARVQVGMVLFRQLAIGLFDLVFRGVFGNSHHLIIIPFISHIYPFLSLSQRLSAR